MLYSDDYGGDVAQSARVGLALLDRHLEDADHEMAHVLADAVAVAGAAIERIESVRAALEDAARHGAIETAEQGREYSRMIISRQHELGEIIREARDAIQAKTIALQRISVIYQNR